MRIPVLLTLLSAFPFFLSRAQVPRPGGEDRWKEEESFLHRMDGKVQRGTQPPGKGPGGTGSPEAVFSPVLTYSSPGPVWQSSRRVCVLADARLELNLRAELNAWTRDMETDGWGVLRYSLSSGTPREVRAFLAERWKKDGIRGCVFVGSLPTAWFEMDDDFFMAHGEFPCDLYYMDLDGSWGDGDKDGLFDSHGPGKGDQRPDIFLGRLAFAPHVSPGVREDTLVRRYLAKVHDFRAGLMPSTGRALSFRDDLWAHLDTGQGKAFSRVVTVNDPAATTGPAFLAELKKNYDSVVTCAASDGLSFSFRSPSGITFVQGADVFSLDPMCFFYNLFGPFTCRFTAKGYLGGAFLLGRNGGLVAVGSAKKGSMLFFGDYYDLLGRGYPAGRAFEEWFARRFPYSRERVRWFYGMTLLGDPTLGLKPGLLSSADPYLPGKGGRVDLSLSFSRKEGGFPYVILASLQGKGTGTPLPGARLPLSVDSATRAFLAGLGSPTCPGWAGILDSTGSAKAALSWPKALPSGVAGKALYLSAVVLDPSTGILLRATPALRVGLGGGKSLTWDPTIGFGLDPRGSGVRRAQGALLPGLVGGSGVLGDFDPHMFAGNPPAGGVLVIDTDKSTVKAEYTLTGKPITVTNGVFEFGSFVVPKGLTIKFKGANVPKIFVRGEAAIQGRIEARGLDAPAHKGMDPYPGKGGGSNCGGAPGGAGAGRKGNGADGFPLAFPKGSPRYNSAAAKAAAGKGSPVFPPSASSVTYHGFGGWICTQLAAGGSGGSNLTRGTKGYATLSGIYKQKYGKTDIPPDNNPGSTFSYLPKLANVPSVLQFLAGGAGGGGGGSSPVGSMKTVALEWHTGQGGGGGGGALLLRCGGSIGIGTWGSILAAGGNSPDPVAAQRAVPGGGGSGGNILFQSGGSFLCSGKVSAPGGKGGKYEEMVFYGGTAKSVGGGGGYGFLRVECPQPPPLGNLVGFLPPPTKDNVGILTDRDAVTGAISYPMPTRDPQARFLRFEVDVKENGKTLTYSDDPSRGKACVFSGSGRTPVNLFLQGGRALGSGFQPGTETFWVRRARDLNDPRFWRKGAPQAVRWVLVLDRSRLPAPSKIEVLSLRVVYF